MVIKSGALLLGLNKMDSYEYTVDWFSHNIPNIEKHLPFKFNKCLEIGCHEGRSTVYWISNNINLHGELFCIDTWDSVHVYNKFINNIKVASDATSIKLIDIIIGYSNEILPTLQLDSFDFIYIDGDHRAEAVYLDLVLSYKLGINNALILCDDYLLHKEFPDLYKDLENDYPYNGINKFIEEYKDKIQIVFSDYQILIRKL